MGYGKIKNDMIISVTFMNSERKLMSEGRTTDCYIVILINESCYIN